MGHRDGITQYTYILLLSSFVECNYFTIYQYLSYGFYCCDKHMNKSYLGEERVYFGYTFTIIIHH